MSVRVTPLHFGLFLAATLVLYNSLINLLPQPAHDRLYLPLNLAVLGLVIFLARRGGFTWLSLGLSPRRLRRSLTWGVVIGVTLPAPLFLAPLLPESLTGRGDFLGDSDAVSAAHLAYLTAVRYPLGTALFEEGVFRGVLFGVWASTAGTRAAMIASSAAFGLWHVVPMLELLRGGEPFASPVLLGLGVFGGVVATFVGGLFFSWIRVSTGGVYGPVVAHWLINALAEVAAYRGLG